MTRPDEIYRNQFAQELGGCPIWGPTHPAIDPVDIGDVGYLSTDGGWIKLFNLRTDVDPTKLPPNSQPGSLVVPNHKVYNGGFVGPRSSKTVREVGVNVKIDGGGVLKSGMRFRCEGEQGAALFVGQDAVTRGVRNQRDFISIMKTHIQDWMKFVEEEGSIATMSDLIFVTGYVRTSVWAAVVFREKDQECKFTLGGALPLPTGTLTAQAKAWASLTVNAFAWNGGPEGRIRPDIQETIHLLQSTPSEISSEGLLEKGDPRHQCVLLKGYRMAERHSWFANRRKTETKDGIEILRITDTYATQTQDLKVQDAGTNDVTQHNIEECNKGDHHVEKTSADSANASTPSQRRKGPKKFKLAKFFDKLTGHNNYRRDDDAGEGAGSSGSLGGPSGPQAGSSRTTSPANQSCTLPETEKGRRNGHNDNPSNAPGPEVEKKDRPSECEYCDPPHDEELSEVANPTPWDILFEYIFKTEERAAFAIIHDDDLAVLNVNEVKPKVYIYDSGEQSD
ncbi:hypothetical protein Clacol_005642 [Clathrus columnatus]|uniref:Uncharacterized protein n=1 Tax=Clathrus columnatus TaxID=1419009 RepID=A0AAV5AFD5_9AGAM|nr:hypothetical protein Clacol_005642 [Clathrus columnatus]